MFKRVHLEVELDLQKHTPPSLRSARAATYVKIKMQTGERRARENR